VFAVALALTGADRRIQHGPGGQADHADQLGGWKAYSGSLGTGLRKVRLIVRCIRHRQPRSVDQLDGAIAPAPTVTGTRAQPLAGGAGQTLNHCQWETLPRAAIAARANALERQAFRRALGCPTIYGTLARTVFRQGLLDEDRQRDRRWVEPFSMLREVGLGQLEQLWTGQQVEEVYGSSTTDAATDPLHLLSRARLRPTLVHTHPVDKRCRENGEASDPEATIDSYKWLDEAGSDRLSRPVRCEHPITPAAVLLCPG